MKVHNPDVKSGSWSNYMNERHEQLSRTRQGLSAYFIKKSPP